MKPTENISVIEIGSNTIRLLIGNLKQGRVYRLYSDRVVTRLGNNLINTKRLNPESIDKSIETIHKFKVLSEKYQSNILIPVGTSVLREAEDSLIFCKTVERITDLKINILSGNEEAFYTLEGTRAGLPEYDDFIAIDIGGGSTEWIYEKDNTIFRGSINIGVLKLRFNLNITCLLENKTNKNYINEIISSLPKINFKYLIATGGTSVTIGMIHMELDDYIPEVIHGLIISRNKLIQIVKRILRTPYEKIKNIRGVSPDRIELIIPGCIILKSLIEHFNSDYIVISDYGFVEGIMKNYKNFVIMNDYEHEKSIFKTTIIKKSTL